LSEGRKEIIHCM